MGASWILEFSCTFDHSVIFQTNKSRHFILCYRFILHVDHLSKKNIERKVPPQLEIFDEIVVVSAEATNNKVNQLPFQSNA
jgi:hypothetical protein